jgi:hypothetical protein
MAFRFSVKRVESERAPDGCRNHDGSDHCNLSFVLFHVQDLGGVVASSIDAASKSLQKKGFFIVRF